MRPLAHALEVDSALETGSSQVGVENDAGAWRHFHGRYYPVAAAFLRKLGVPDGELEDATQEVFLQVHRYLPRFRGDSELSTWLYRICITEARRGRRRQRLRSALLQVLSLVPRETLVSTPSFCEETARRRIEAALAELTEAERNVFVLYEMEGLPGKRIAEILECPEATIFRRLHYARRAFRRALDSRER